MDESFGVFAAFTKLDLQDEIVRMQSNERPIHDRGGGGIGIFVLTHLPAPLADHPQGVVLVTLVPSQRRIERLSRSRQRLDGQNQRVHRTING